MTQFSHMMPYAAGCPPTVSEAAAGIDNYVNQRNRQQKIFPEPLYSYVNLLGVAQQRNPLTFVLPAERDIEVFRTPKGSIGQGWPTEMDDDVTNFEGDGMFPAGIAYSAFAVGIDLSQIRIQRLGLEMVRYGMVEQKKYSNQWKLGALRNWPEGTIGYFSGAVATTVPNDFQFYPMNGRQMAAVLPVQARLEFSALDQLIFKFRFAQDLVITTDGQPWNGIPFGTAGSNAPDPAWGVPLGVILWGTKFEQSAQ